MDIGSSAGIASAATTIANSKASNDRQVTVLNKALDAQVQNAAGLIRSMPSPPQSVPDNQALPEHLGRNINVTA